ncbi:MAG: N-acetylmuramoyl-L-alanine amidase [Janthinobacterium lividum]
MAGLRRRSPAFRRCLCILCLAALGSPWANAQAADTSSWQAALSARQSFEAEPAEEHTHDEFAQVMNNFRAIYHGNPGDVHAPRAVDQVAQLLAEQGRQLNDPKSLRAAAGQYEFLAKAYPQSSLAAPALAHALDLLGQDGVRDPAEITKIRLLLKQYPHGIAVPETATAMRPAATPVLAVPAATPETAIPAARDSIPAETSLAVQPSEPQTAFAMVTGIRHWSTSSYTRVAIDLGGEVEFQAARVEHPDRIYFDLHGARLSPGLTDKTFTITDDGFLKKIHAGQSGKNITRIVLDVQPVAEYSAFLLPNPSRLIIDIHGRQPGEPKAIPLAADLQKKRPEPATDGGLHVHAVPPEQPPAPVSRPSPNGAVTTNATSTSTLPPMPVTDGSASFGLPPKRTEAVAAAGPVARPRVVVSAKPTVAKPVPNSVTSSTPESSREVAAVSDGEDVIAATPRPTSKPVVDRSSRFKAGKPSATNPGSPKSLESASPTTPPPPTADGQSTLMRALGLKIGRIVIDAGHGGHDSGTLGPDGVEEKDVVLDVALRLGRLLHDRLGAEVVYTRADDTFVPLETRTAIANKAQADLFVSVHANSSQDPSARGVEVYYLNFTSDPEAMQVASRENAVSSQRVNQLSDLVKKIALKDKIDESRELAADVDQSLYAGLKKGNGGLKDRGVKKAPFVVLIGANMPSILAEISFVTNPEDEAKLDTPEYRERVAESLYGGIARYAGEINGARPKTRGTERAER